MSSLLPSLQGRDFANVCAEHTRRIQLLSGQFWQGDIDLWHYRKLSRELTQQFMNELSALLNRTVG
jgi:hypothetical protein